MMKSEQKAAEMIGQVLLLVYLSLLDVGFDVVVYVDVEEVAGFFFTGLDVIILARANQFRLNLLQLTRLTLSREQNRWEKISGGAHLFSPTYFVHRLEAVGACWAGLPVKPRRDLRLPFSPRMSRHSTHLSSVLSSPPRFFGASRPIAKI